MLYIFILINNYKSILKILIKIPLVLF